MRQYPYFVRLFQTSTPLRTVELSMKKESRDLVASAGHLCLILEFPGNKKHQGQHQQEHLRLLSNYGDRVTFHRLTAYHLFLGSHFDGTLASCDSRDG